MAITETAPRWQTRRRRRHGKGGRPHEKVGANAEGLATGIGCFSIALGLAELAAPASVARLIGVPDDDRTRNVLRAIGLREVVSGIGILSQPQAAGWVWLRVGGDVMDLGLLGAAMTSDRARTDKVATTAAAVAGVAALDAMCGSRLRSRGGAGAAMARIAGVSLARTIHVTRTITVGRPAEELYRYWRNFENLPRFMWYLESVRVIDDRRSHWETKAPLGGKMEWDAEIIEDKSGERIAWRSLEGADVPNRGFVSFERAPGGRGTVVRVGLEYEPPGGAIGATLAKLFGREPGQMVQEDLRRFKELMEVGEIVQSDATARGWGPARPPEG